jgi:hypothetical protein
VPVTGGVAEAVMQVVNVMAATKRDDGFEEVHCKECNTKVVVVFSVCI